MSLWRQLRHSAPVRKSIAAALQVPRAVRRARSRRSDFERSPPVLVNSFPKSGTHLLLQVARSLPGTRSYGSFIASMPSLTFRERTPEKHVRLLRRIVPGEVVPAHLFHDERYERELTERNCLHLFIYRDPRDVAVSEAHYLATMNRWHRLHPYFARLDAPEERLALAIGGVADDDFPYDYPDIGARFARYRGWLHSDQVLALRYEDLISERRAAELERIVAAYTSRHSGDWDPGAAVAAAQAAIDPDRSHTFRRGGSGGWRDAFEPEHRRLMKDVAGRLLIELGYEDSLDW